MHWSLQLDRFWKLAVVSLVLFAIAMPLSYLSAQDGSTWTQWRGAKWDNISHATNIPAEWTEENILWRLPLPGPAGASPIVWEDRIFLTTVDGDDLMLYCVGDDGEIRWTQKVSEGDRQVRGGEGNSASPSPFTDGEHVWAMMTDGVLACYTVDGELVWRKDLQEEYGAFNIQFGMATTPILDKGRIYVQLIHGDMRDRSTTSTGWIVALDAKSGDEIWVHERHTDGVAENKHVYTSPLVYRDDDHEFLVVHGADYTTAHSLQYGSELWRVGGYNPKDNYDNFLRFVASPAAVPGTIVAPSAKRGPVFALPPDLSGFVSEDDEGAHWRSPRYTPDVSTPLIHDGLVYLTDERGTLTVLDQASGEVVYQEHRLYADRHRSTPVYADGKIFINGRDGTVTVIKPGREFEVLARNELGEELTSSPAVVDGRIYIRTFEALYAIGQ